MLGPRVTETDTTSFTTCQQDSKARLRKHLAQSQNRSEINTDPQPSRGALGVSTHSSVPSVPNSVLLWPVSVRGTGDVLLERLGTILTEHHKHPLTLPSFVRKEKRSNSVPMSSPPLFSVELQLIMCLPISSHERNKELTHWPDCQLPSIGPFFADTYCKSFYSLPRLTGLHNRCPHCKGVCGSHTSLGWKKDVTRSHVAVKRIEHGMSTR